MIVDERVLREDFVPGEVVHRHDEITHLSETLEPLLYGDRPETTFLFGPTGVGKTCLARYTLGQLREQLPEIRTVYINCWQEYTRFRVLYRVLEATGADIDIHRSTPKDELFQRLVRTDDQPIVVILDEVDQLEETEALYDLHRLRHVSLVLIANREEELFAQFDDRVRSRLRAGTRVKFDRYGTDELVSILEERASQGLEPGVVTDAQLRTIADDAAGDARVGIGVLRSAARRATREGVESVTDDIVAAAIPNARTAIRRETVEGLIEHQRVLYDVIADADEIEPSDLYEEYEQRVDDPKTTRTLRNYLTKMIHYDLIEAVGQKRGRSYRVLESDVRENGDAADE
ncbi:orc1/cdc6 family replication initiation protein [Halobacteria archaeon AArc-m2/3/4]|uniref:ORC1-type DNA replication protein n=1 Tax=Natronoglomus mannanivorans TaxID=2979990 RepID=A0AAP3E0T3_9EURY|nr:orc1/cdc6 family replication initiation protein [Halobacteria archaeon AArc-xg1-1]MCU4972662.1 orc1/cdc6 family replication initiation protein [Halobacteria archaeon AArc-m2/3/4]